MLLDRVKDALDITGAGRDEYITGLVESAKEDLRRVGVTCTEDTPLRIRAIVLYCQWLEDYEGQGDRYRLMYTHLRDSLSQNEDYNA